MLRNLYSLPPFEDRIKEWSTNDPSEDPSARWVYVRYLHFNLPHDYADKARLTQDPANHLSTHQWMKIHRWSGCKFSHYAIMSRYLAEYRGRCKTFRRLHALQRKQEYVADLLHEKLGKDVAAIIMQYYSVPQERMMPLTVPQNKQQPYYPWVGPELDVPQMQLVLGESLDRTGAERFIRSLSFSPSIYEQFQADGENVCQACWKFYMKPLIDFTIDEKEAD